MESQFASAEIQSWIASREFGRLKGVLGGMGIHALAALLVDLSEQERPIAFRVLPTETAAEVLALLEPDQQAELLTTLKSQHVADIINEMAPDDRTELLEEMPGELAQKILSHLRGDELQIALDLLAYPEESIGRLMTPEYVAVRRDWTIEQVLRHIRKIADSRETCNIVYVVDKQWRLLDEIPLEDIVLADPEQIVEQLMDGQFGCLHARDDQEAAVEAFKTYDALALPVVDGKGTLVGIVTFDDVMDVQEEESTEDFQKITGMVPLEESYFAAGFWRMFRKRLPWLVLLLGAQMLTTIALTGFSALPLFAVMVVFMPLINSPAGNAGSQMAGLMIRGLAVQEIELRDWFRVLGRELIRGLAFGLLLAGLGYAAALVFCRFLPGAEQADPHTIAAAVALAMLVAVTLANLVGSMLPFVFKRLGLDPAVTSGPFIASVMDVTGIMIYFSVGVTILHAR